MENEVSQYSNATFIMLAIYMVAVLIVVIRGALKTKSVADYATGSITFSPIMVGLSVAAAMTSAATFIINPGIIATFGWSAFLSYGVFLPVSALIALVVLSKKFRSHGSASNASTLPQWIGNRFQSKALKNWFAYSSLLLLTFLVLICVGLSQIIGASLNLSPQFVLWFIVLFVFGYMMFGGANALVYTNTIQAIIMVVVAVIILTSGNEHFSNGVQGFIQKLNAIDPLLTKSTRPDSPLFRDYFEIIIAQCVIGFAVVCQPHIITKSMLLKKESDVNKYLFYAVVVQLLFFMVVFAGFYARIQFPDLTLNGVKISTDTIMSKFVVQRFPVYVGLLVVLGLISAGISTLEGLIQSLSTTFVADIFQPNIKNLSEKQWFWFHKIIIVVMGIVTAVWSYKQLGSPNFSVAMLAQNGVYAFFASAVIPVFCGLFFPNTSSKIIFIAAVSALLIHFSIYYFEIGPYMQLPVKNPAIPASIAILSSASIVAILSLLNKLSIKK